MFCVHNLPIDSVVAQKDEAIAEQAEQISQLKREGPGSRAHTTHPSFHECATIGAPKN